ncbi:diguanylate cyclase [Isosphaera pallida ATCC 43644]|uniref:diguanylate cyclase n=2 Tax=Isosphaera pallida TaxID=128 RepID=E8R2L1_ISOPI|nr:diguanylate cyclase [Isosphaera pallida ATCC 43644]
MDSGQDRWERDQDDPTTRHGLSSTRMTHSDEATQPHQGRERVQEEGAEDKPTPGLLVQHGGLMGQLIRLNPGVSLIGRDARHPIWFRSLAVSRDHARIHVRDDAVILQDLKSRNGTYLRGHRLGPEPVKLRENDIICISPEVRLKFLHHSPRSLKHHEEMFNKVVRDDLTGLYNRMYVVEMLEGERDRNAYRGLGLALALIDLDRFKSINDTYGHQVGDQVLIELGGLLCELIPPPGFSARLGGEEFLSVYPAESLEFACRLAETIRIRVANQPFGMQTLGFPLHLTTSIGLLFLELTETRQPDDRSEHWITRADGLLYRAKAMGRDQVMAGINRPDYWSALDNVSGEVSFSKAPGVSQARDEDPAT